MPLSLAVAALVLAAPPLAPSAGAEPFDVPRLQFAPSLTGRDLGKRPALLLRPSPSRRRSVVPAESKHRHDEQGPVILEMGPDGAVILRCPGHLFPAR